MFYINLEFYFHFSKRLDLIVKLIMSRSLSNELLSYTIFVIIYYGPYAFIDI